MQIFFEKNRNILSTLFSLSSNSFFLPLSRLREVESERVRERRRTYSSIAISFSREHDSFPFTFFCSCLSLSLIGSSLSLPSDLSLFISRSLALVVFKSWRLSPFLKIEIARKAKNDLRTQTTSNLVHSSFAAAEEEEEEAPPRFSPRPPARCCCCCCC